MLKLCVKARSLFNRLTRKEEGATMVEYAIMVGLIAVVAIATVTLLGVDVNRIFGVVKTDLDAVK